MSSDDEFNIAATSAMVGAMATLLQELVASGSINGPRMQQRLSDFATQEAVRNAPTSERVAVEAVIDILKLGIDTGKPEGENNANP